MKPVIPELNLTNRLIRLYDEWTVKAVKYGIGTPEKYRKNYCHYLLLLYLGYEGIRKRKFPQNRKQAIKKVLYR
jgi:hypothetical protein